MTSRTTSWRENRTAARPWRNRLDFFKDCSLPFLDQLGHCLAIFKIYSSAIYQNDLDNFSEKKWIFESD